MHRYGYFKNGVGVFVLDLFGSELESLVGFCEHGTYLGIYRMWEYGD
jgi:hypothetical protein